MYNFRFKMKKVDDVVFTAKLVEHETMNEAKEKVYMVTWLTEHGQIEGDIHTIREVEHALITKRWIKC